MRRSRWPCKSLSIKPGRSGPTPRPGFRMLSIPTNIFSFFRQPRPKTSHWRVSQHQKLVSPAIRGRTMSADAQRVQAVFLAAVEITDAAERAAYLEREFSADPDLRQRVEALLRAHEAPASILARPMTPPIDVDQNQAWPTLPLDASADQAGPFVGKRMPDQATRETDGHDQDPSALEILEPSTKPGSLGRLGHYEVLEVLGQGGFGTVVKAYDEKLQRTIAIKIMSPRLAATSPARK